MWRPPIPINFLTLHYAWIIFCSLLGIVVFLPYGNVPAIDAYFFGASASTESGLNTIDVKDLKTYQQLFIYFIPMFTNLGFINTIVVAVRLYWFERHIRRNGNKLLARSRHGSTEDIEAQTSPEDTSTGEKQQETSGTGEARTSDSAASDAEYPKLKQRAITFSADANPPPNDTKALYVPPPMDRDNDEIKPVESHPDTSGTTKRRPYLHDGPSLSAARSIEQAAASMFVLGPSQSQARRQSDVSARPRVADLPYLSKTATVGRNSQFHNLTAQDRDRLGEVNALPTGPRILAAIFQAASARHTGTSTFNLAKVNPGVQFSLLVMMYIAIFPIAISMRSSNTYEETSLGFYAREQTLDESRSSSYVMAHIRNQLSFDLWYVFLGTFCICVTEADKIMDLNDPAFSVFAIFFEVMSGYGNVGLSLGHPDVMTSLSGQFRTFSKVVICAMMIRGRHRGLPYAVDRAIMLPDERRSEDGREVDAATKDQ
ncbi:hypothetical protein DL769_011391 [Monosporascus sp. CRB-8-3]|nr:hypothetical protein DL769_011391 [Monosporascus sp. CRB-8-3]